MHHATAGADRVAIPLCLHAAAHDDNAVIRIVVILNRQAEPRLVRGDGPFANSATVDDPG